MTPIKVTESIKTMQLYSHIDRVWNELDELQVPHSSEDTVPVQIMNRFDCYNYGLESGVLKIIPFLNINEASKVLDIGAGLGGPARCISNATKARIVGIEIQHDIAALGNALCRSCKIDDAVTIIPGDFLDDNIDLGQQGSFSAAVSWLVILHIPLNDRKAVFDKVFSLLKPGGKVYIEDFFHLGDAFTSEEKVLLAEEVYVPCGELPTREAYEDVVRAAGFACDFQDATQEWTAFTKERHDLWVDNRERHVRVHNEETWTALNRFYTAMVTLFSGGNLGGVKITLTKPV